MEVLQFNESDVVINGNNILEITSFEQPVIFNETYIIIGENIIMPSVYSCYDLTVKGNMKVSKIEVKGNLTVIGNIESDEIKCDNDILCTGDIRSNDIYVGGNLISDNLNVVNLEVGKNIMLKTSADIKNKAVVEQAIVAGEGIIGSGTFEATEAVAVDYFDFDGNIESNVVELLTGKKIQNKNSINVDADNKQLKIDELLDKVKKQINYEIFEAGEIDEDSIQNLVKNWADLDCYEISNMDKLLSLIIDLSYNENNGIYNLRDYLIAFYANEIMPENIKNYESVSHVFDNWLPRVKNSFYSLKYKAYNIDELILSLYIINKYEDKIPFGTEALYDKIFQSVGIKYSTVKSFLK